MSKSPNRDASRNAKPAIRSGPIQYANYATPEQTAVYDRSYARDARQTKLPEYENPDRYEDDSPPSYGDRTRAVHFDDAAQSRPPRDDKQRQYQHEFGPLSRQRTQDSGYMSDKSMQKSVEETARTRHDGGDDGFGGGYGLSPSQTRDLVYRARDDESERRGPPSKQPARMEPLAPAPRRSDLAYPARREEEQHKSSRHLDPDARPRQQARRDPTGVEQTRHRDQGQVAAVGCPDTTRRRHDSPETQLMDDDDGFGGGYGLAQQSSRDLPPPEYGRHSEPPRRKGASVERRQSPPRARHRQYHSPDRRHARDDRRDADRRLTQPERPERRESAAYHARREKKYHY